MKIRNNGGVLGPKSNTSTTAASGVWSVQELYQNQRDGTWPTAVDPSGDLYFNQTVSLFHGDGTNGGNNNTVLDSSTNALTITRNGNVAQGTFSPYSQADGYWSANFPGGDFLSSSSSNISALGTGDFTVECWVYVNTMTYGGIFQISGSSGGISSTYTGGILVSVNGGTLLFDVNGTDYTTTYTVPIGQWFHFAMVRQSGIIKIYINGNSIYSVSNSTNITGTYIAIGAYYSSSYSLKGYISNFRVVKGTAVYTSTFTPSTIPLTAISGTEVLTCQSNRFKDNSTNAYTFNAWYGTAQTQPFSPFQKTAAYSASTNGGSAYFDGSGDYLTSSTSTSLALGTNDFTVEYWILFDGYSGNFNAGVMQFGTTGYTPYFGYFSSYNGSISFSYYLSSNNSSWDIANSRTILSSSNLYLKQWYHIAFTRSGSTFKTFVNGTQVDTFTSSASIYIPSNQFRLAYDGYVQCYLSDVRVVNGTAVYTANFTTPTAPLTAVTNTKCLLSFTNSSILDNTNTNTIETVGSAQISTTQSKFGGSSMYFNGSTDALSIKGNSNLDFGSGDFTIECWAYVVTKNNATLFHRYNSSDSRGHQFLLCWDGTVFRLFYDENGGTSSYFTITDIVVTNTWTHFAVVRSGNAIYVYTNGIQVGSAVITVGNVINGTGNMYLGAYNTGSYGYYLNGYIDEFRITKGVCRYPYNFTPPTKAFPNYGTQPSTPSSDSYFGSTSTLLHGDGANGLQNQTFLDSSTNALTVTRNGNATQGTFSPFSRADGYWSNYNGVLTIPNNAVLNMGTGDFTVECWVFSTNISGYQGIFSSSGSSGTDIQCHLQNGALRFSSYTVLIFTSDAIIPTNQWVHIAFVRSSGTTTGYINGVNVKSAADTTNWSTASDYRVNGAFNSYEFAGYISNLRVVKGTAVYTSNFTPSTIPLTAISGTSLLTHQSNKWKDNSTNALSVTPYSGTPTIQTFTPFEPTTAYSASINGGSGYFDGSGDYLVSATNSSLALGTNNFTVEYWAYFTSVTTGSTPLTVSDGASTYEPLFGYYDSSKLQIYMSSNGSGWDIFSGQSITNSLTLNEWHHIAITRSGNTFRTFFDGILGTTTTSSASVYQGANSVCMGKAQNQVRFTGYMSDVRVIVGTAQYTAAFTPPTAPLTAVTNTKFLCNFTNAGITDNSATTVMETIGDSKASTTQYKYGTGAMYFDGTGDYIIAPSNQAFSFGSGDFTVECWMYLNAVGSIQGIWTNGPTSIGSFGMYITASNKLEGAIYGLSGVTGTTALSVSTWYHLAVTRSNGGLFRVFVNGVIDASSSGYTQNNTSSQFMIGDAWYNYGSRPNAYIDDFRITKGYARYLNNFTPPTLAYPNY